MCGHQNTSRAGCRAARPEAVPCAGGCRMYRMCRPAGAADPARPSPARLSPRCWATSWHSLRRHRRCFSTPSSPLSQRTPTPPRLSVHFVFQLPAGHARGFCDATVGRVVSSVSRASLLATWGSREPSLGICCWPRAEVDPETQGQMDSI